MGPRISPETRACFVPERFSRPQAAMSWATHTSAAGATASGGPTPYQWRDRRWLACPSTRCARPGRSGHRPWNRKYHCRRLGKPAEPADICGSSSVLSSYVARGRLAACGKRLRSLLPPSLISPWSGKERRLRKEAIAQLAGDALAFMQGAIAIGHVS
jgi:hypothetical protein